MSLNGEKLVALHNLHAEIHMLLAHYFTGVFVHETRPLSDEPAIAQTLDIMIEVIEQKIKKEAELYDKRKMNNVVLADFKNKSYQVEE
jgi:hypothetical protein